MSRHLTKMHYLRSLLTSIRLTTNRLFEELNVLYTLTEEQTSVDVPLKEWESFSPEMSFPIRNKLAKCKKWVASLISSFCKCFAFHTSFWNVDCRRYLHFFHENVPSIDILRKCAEFWFSLQFEQAQHSFCDDKIFLASYQLKWYSFLRISHVSQLFTPIHYFGSILIDTFAFIYIAIAYVYLNRLQIPSFVAFFE